MSPTLGAGSSSAGGADSFSDRQFMVVTSEKTARVIALPSQNCVYRQQITDTDYVVKAEIISLKGMIERVGFEKKAMTNEMVMGNIDSTNKYNAQSSRAGDTFTQLNEGSFFNNSCIG